jgi:single-strand DNA-binding protein
VAGTVNKVMLVGNLGANPEVRHSQEGIKVAFLSVATSESWKDRTSGDKRSRTEWHRVVIFNDRLVDLAEKFLKKGSKVYIEGQLQTRKWTDQQGYERYTTEVVLSRFRGDITMLDTRADSVEGQGNNTSEADVALAPSFSVPQEIEDDIPF